MNPRRQGQCFSAGAPVAERVQRMREDLEAGRAQGPSQASLGLRGKGWVLGWAELGQGHRICAFTDEERGPLRP